MILIAIFLLALGLL
jgi:hypothetical protein